MYNDDIMPSERVGQKYNSDKRGEYADRWEGAMDDAPEFSGEWGYGNPEDSVAENSEENYAVEAMPGTNLEQNITPDSELGNASRLSSYGFDTASRMYGLNAVLDAIVETDETGLNAENPIGAIYARLAPNPDQREFLYQEIQKERVIDNRLNSDPALNTPNNKLGFTSDGDFYDRVQYGGTNEQTSIDAIRSLRHIIQILETSEKFAGVRARAAEHQKSIVEYLVNDQANPTLSHLLNRVGSEMSEDEIEELVNDLEAEANDNLEFESNNDTEIGVDDNLGIEANEDLKSE